MKSVELEWDDNTIPHKIWIEEYVDCCKVLLKVIKDAEPEILSTFIPFVTIKDLVTRWSGKAENLTPAYQDGVFFCQVRRLFKLEFGSIIWVVTHIDRDGFKYSVDRIKFVDL